MKDYPSLIKKEEKRVKEVINLIASENYASLSVRKAVSSVFTDKYAEGYPKKRYCAGNEIVDELEEAVEKDALKTFSLSSKKWCVNVQPYSGSIANLAVYSALVPKGGKIMAMDLSMGGHLTHGSKVSITGKFWKQIPYGVSRKTEMLDYAELMKIAKKEKPELIIAGGSAYSRHIDFRKFKAIANAVNAIFMVDMSHFAGLVAGKAHPSPFPYADIVTSTTHKTLRGPRAALIFSKKEYSELINRAVFPGLQGGPHMNTISSIGEALREAQSSSFKKYALQTVKNARALSHELSRLGFRVVSLGTDTHLFLIDLTPLSIGGRDVSELLEQVGIITNKNMIPFDLKKPTNPSGIRLGTPAVTTRGMKEKEMKVIATLISSLLYGKASKVEIRKKVLALAKRFSI